VVQLSHRIRGALVDSPNSLGAQARARRWNQLLGLFPQLRDMHVVDLGGTTEYWRRAPVRPASVTVLNLTEPGDSDEDWLVPVMGDACDAVEALRQTGREVYDIVISNAVIEHVGGHGARVRFAESVHALAPRHWVQTPYRYFPLEPHWLFPGMQFLPIAARAQVALHWRLQHTRALNPADALASVQWTDLVGRTEMRSYFPTSELLAEKVGPLTKSLIAVRA